MAFTNEERADLFRKYKNRKSPIQEFDDDLRLIRMVENDLKKIANGNNKASPRKMANQIITFMNGFGWNEGRKIMFKYISEEYKPLLSEAFDILKTDIGNARFEETFRRFIQNEKFCRLR